MTLKERMTKVETTVDVGFKNLEGSLCNLKNNHMKHLEERIEKLDEKFTERLNKINDKVSSLAVKVAMVTGTVVIAIEIARDIVIK